MNLMKKHNCWLIRSYYKLHNDKFGWWNKFLKIEIVEIWSQIFVNWNDQFSMLKKYFLLVMNYSYSYKEFKIRQIKSSWSIFKCVLKIDNYHSFRNKIINRLFWFETFLINFSRKNWFFWKQGALMVSIV